MTLLNVVRDVCSFVGVEVPTSVFSNINASRTMTEMLALANEMAQRMALNTREWQALKSVAVFHGDGVATEFSLPANYGRMLLSSNVWRALEPVPPSITVTGSAQSPMRFIPDTDEWLRRRFSGNVEGSGEWTILGGKMHIYPVLQTGTVAWFPFLDKNCVTLFGGGTGDAFVNDNDTYRLDERLLKLNMIWQWKAQKGSPYAEDMGTYQDALMVASGADQPAPIIIGRMPISASARVAYPWPVPT